MTVLLENFKENHALIIASHNEETVSIAEKVMAEHNL